MDESASRVLFEVAPDPNNAELSGRWNKMDDAGKLEVSRLVATNIIPKVFSAIGIKGVVREQFGGYLNDTNPSFAAIIPSGTEPSRELAGFALSQDSMMVVSAKPMDGADKVGIITVHLPKDISIQQAHSVYQELHGIDDGVVQGHTTVNGEMTFVDYSGDTAGLAAKIHDVLGDRYDVSHGEGYAAFPQKEDYGYGSEAGASEMAAGRAVGDNLRHEAAAAIERELTSRGKSARAGGKTAGRATTKKMKRGG